MKLIALHIEEGSLKGLDDLVRRGWYPNRSEAIRFAVKDLLELHRK